MYTSVLHRCLVAVLILFAVVPVAGCEDEVKAHPEVEYKPALLPIKFTVGPDGIDVAGESTIVTPIGVFSVNAKYELPPQQKDSIFVVIRDRHQGKSGFDSVYEVRAGGGALKAVVNGRTEIAVADGQVTIDVTAGDIKVIQLQKTEVIAVAQRPEGMSTWWDQAAGKWNTGYDRSPYKPFMLSRGAYDDATISIWYGIGFLVFLVRLALAVLMIPFDIVLTIVFLIAQFFYLFWEASGQNVVWGLLVLVVVVLLWQARGELMWHRRRRW
ncbi:hypothetical protein [Actinoplanes sp. GCM10030250]|uniref:hypothetical protein n=1 Tax=Actinoplanes sp. GCM10030250 TaxID=3273376 RepID=UPI003619A79F